MVCYARTRFYFIPGKIIPTMNMAQHNAILEQINQSFRVKEDILSHISTPLHYHPHYEIVWIKKGTGTRIVGDHIAQFKEGDMVLLGPNLPHVWENDKIYYEEHPGLTVDVYVIHFTDTIMENLLKFPELNTIKETLQKSRCGLQITGKTNDELAKIIIKLALATSIERIILFLSIFLHLEDKSDTAQLSTTGFAGFFNEQKSERLCKIYEYIGKNFYRNIPVREISNVACMSPAAFCRYFKQKTGYSFVTYLNNFRLGYAVNLLNNNQYKISTIAEMCGFRDISYFNRMFKQKHEITPTQYIRNNQYL